jgi:hydroxyacid-oxoacid transhydrogenase
MSKTGVPNGVGGVGYREADLPDLVKGTLVQKRLVDNAPLSVDEAAMTALFRGALECW